MIRFGHLTPDQIVGGHGQGVNDIDGRKAVGSPENLAQVRDLVRAKQRIVIPVPNG